LHIPYNIDNNQTRAAAFVVVEFQSFRSNCWSAAVLDGGVILVEKESVTPTAQSVEEQGFAVLRDLIAPGEIATLLDSLMRITLRRSRAGARHVLHHPEVVVVAHDPRLLSIARQVLGETAFAFRATFFDKSPNSNWLIPWHQDTALPLLERRETPGWGPWSVKDGVNYAHAPASALTQVVALRLHLDDSTSENGPLRVLPGTHNMGVLSDAEVCGLADERPAVECIVSKGGVLAMRPLIVHASSKSQSQDPRRVLHIEYAACRGFRDGLQLAVA
jgi:ectoine hydroxylase-related dioxygenase (phytanoyl-CoA dioxygenase family)